MRIETERLVIRDLERKDQEQLYKIFSMKATKIRIYTENRHDNKTSETEAFESMESAL